ncbi:hypothetical protein [Calycomorphotria hydatis]|uniref:Uncharacterized protein n=1 Tax=Calycomorphotria hydatis TaxID=2528027 RepID=A0A517TBR5_9PLAN|nr:hypothetical protein [Calycomorphotria hydatis]QDT65817.1 hypothetical protein V22_30790 [Calycomorphotria hydatis]
MKPNWKFSQKEQGRAQISLPNGLTKDIELIARRHNMTPEHWLFGAIYEHVDHEQCGGKSESIQYSGTGCSCGSLRVVNGGDGLRASE